MPFLLAERARRNCARSMRAVKGNLDRSRNKCLKQGGMRLDGRGGTNKGIIPGEENKLPWKDQSDR